MELDDLKTTWRSIEGEIGQISINSVDEIQPGHKRDVKASLIIRFRWGITALIVAVIFIGTSHLWAAIKMPVWWIGAFSILLISGIAVMTLLMRKIARINLGEDTQLRVMEQILSIKKIYRLTEVYGCAVILGLIVAGVLCSPIPYGAVDIVVVSVTTIVCYSMEIIIYRLNIKRINKMQNWLNEP